MRRNLCIGFINFIRKCKSLTDFTNLFSPNNFFKKWWSNFELLYDCLKMVECNSIETSNIHLNLDDQ